MSKILESESLEERLESSNNTSSNTPGEYETKPEPYETPHYEVKVSVFDVIKGVRIIKDVPAYAMDGAYGYTWRDGTIYVGQIYDEEFYEEVVMHEFVHNDYTRGNQELPTRKETQVRMDYLHLPISLHSVYRN